MNERAAFGLELRRIRERRGLTLEQLCDQTKVGASHYAALEAGDLSRWPSGIFRRAFVRSYAAAVGLDPDQVLAEFNRVFPDPADGPRAVARIEAARREQEAIAAAQGAGEPKEDFAVFRLALDPPRPEHGAEWFRKAGPRAAVATADVLLALVPAGLASLAFGRAWFLPAAVGIAFLGHVVYHSMTGATPGSWIVDRIPRELSGRLANAAARRRPDEDGSAPPRRRFTRRSAGRPSSHARRVSH